MLALILKPMVFKLPSIWHHPRQRTPFTPLAMNLASSLALHQLYCLQRLLDPCIAQPDLVFLAELMEVTHVQVEVLVPVETENLFRLPLLTLAGCLASVVSGPVIPEGLAPQAAFRQRRICRLLITTNSAASSHHLIFFALARNNASCNFIARSIAVISDRPPYSRARLHPRRPKSGHFTCYKHRTYYVLTTLSKMTVTRLITWNIYVGQ